MPFTTLLMNASVKLDRLATRTMFEALTESELASFKNLGALGTISTETEKSLQEIWIEVLN